MSEPKFIVLTPKRAIRVGGVKAGNDYLDTLSYLPGSVLRGAMAEWLIQSGRESSIVPIVQRIRFGNLFPSVMENFYTLPFPMTALECKMEGGFRQVRRKQWRKQGHGIRDSLLIAIAYAELKRMGARFPVPMALRCHECKGRMERVSGFYGQVPEGWTKVSMEQAMQTKVALSRYRRAAQEQMLYRVIALRPQVVFVGRVWLDDDSDWDLLHEAVKNVGVGALTTRGFGTACLEESKARLPSVRERIIQFNERLREVWRDLAHLGRQVKGNIPDEPDGIYFSVDLLAPAILHDEHYLPTLKLTLRLNGEFLQPMFWTTQPAFAGGWSTAWGLPKPTALTAAMGSVYVFHSRQSLDALLPHLEALEAQGVGDRTGEGLGEILICHPFHSEVNPT